MSPFTPEQLIARIPRCTCHCLVNLHTVTARPVKQRGVCMACGPQGCPRYTPAETPTPERPRHPKVSATC